VVVGHGCPGVHLVLGLCRPSLLWLLGLQSVVE